MPYKTIWTSLLLAFVMAVPVVSHAETKIFRTKKDGGSRVTFVSDAPLETTTGVSSVVTGSVTFDPADLSTTTGSFEVPVDTLRTGVDLRDEHLAGENWLDAKKNPNAHFQITEVTGAKTLTPNKDTKVKVKGKFTVHGITQFVTANATVRWIPFSDELKGTPGITNDVLRVKADFKIKLEDHQVSVPSIVRLKVSNDIAVSVDLRAMAD